MDMDEVPARSRSAYLALLWALVPLITIGGFAFWYMFSPVNTFHLTCTYTVNARVTADIVVGGQVQSASAVFQNSRSRGWISIMNAAGCIQPYGNAMAFRPPGDRVLLVPAVLCKKAIEALDNHGSADVLSACNGKNDYQNWAVLVDSATRPSRWRNVTNGNEFTISRMVASSTWDNPSDNIDTIAPNLLKADLERANVKWNQSAERLLPYKRRAQSKTRGEPFEFNIEYGSFKLN
jgi:hypothetical protein